jgi:hypothetical protein
MIDYPAGNFYRVPNTDAIDAILDAIERIPWRPSSSWPFNSNLFRHGLRH